MSLVNSLKNNSAKKSTEYKLKKRNWACVIYPESLPTNWIEILEKTGLQIAVSPLHDRDVEADEQTPKKPHYHVILCYSGPTTFSIVKKITDSLNAPNPISLEAVRGYYRYLTHKDNPEKAQYDENEIRHLNGFSIIDFLDLSKSEVAKIKKFLRQKIEEEKITEFWDFMAYVENFSDEYYDVASGNTFYFSVLIRSFRHKLEKNRNAPNNPPQTAADIMKLGAEALNDSDAIF